MNKKTIQIDQTKCNGCGACAAACHEGAIEMIDGVAVLTREDHCDGLGDCLPACPTGAITLVEKQAPSTLYKKAACPGNAAKLHTVTTPTAPRATAKSQLMQWPCQIKLIPINAPYFDSAELLIAADCAAYAYASFHEDFMRDHITLIGCPKLDGVDYTEKLTAIIKTNNIKSIRIVRMEVPCCSRLELAVKNALQESQKTIPCRVITLSTDGKIIQ